MSKKKNPHKNQLTSTSFPTCKVLKLTLTCCGSSLMTPVFPNRIRLFFKEDSFLFSLDGEFKVISSFSSGISKNTNNHTIGHVPGFPFQHHNLPLSCSLVHTCWPFCSVSGVTVLPLHSSPFSSKQVNMKEAQQTQESLNLYLAFLSSDQVWVGGWAWGPLGVSTAQHKNY